MKFLTLLFCAAALTASSAYCMKTPAAVTPQAPQSSWGWKKHLASGMGKLVCGAALPVIAIPEIYKHAFNTKETTMMALFWGSCAALASAGHTSYQSFKKAYSAYRGTTLPVEKSPNWKTQFAATIGKLTGLIMPAYVIYTTYKAGIKNDTNSGGMAPVFLTSAIAAAAVLTPPAYRSLKKTVALYQEEKQAHTTTSEKTA